MPDLVIQAENLGKKYTIGHQAENGRYTALRDVLMQNARSLWHKTRDLVQGKPIVQGDTLEEVWALKDVSFEIRQGEVVGIIGRNGAGKSTLLKVLSRITEPSAGRVTIKGRVASLLEVGTGFHPELTGRENIYLNGAILGMTRQEIKRKFDEIVAFAEIEKFLDTPVKRYSSGMYVRLAFAVAAHLEPETLIVDEVLAVGDAEFQKKCLGKMGDVARDGRTVLFVSHNMGAISSLCNRSILLDKGKLASDGPTFEIVNLYTNGVAMPENTPTILVQESQRIRGTGDVRVERIIIGDQCGNLRNTFAVWEPLKISLRLNVRVDRTIASCWLLISRKDEHIVVLSTFQYDFMESMEVTRGFYECTSHIDSNVLVPGTYFISVGVFSRFGEFYEWIEEAGMLVIEPRLNIGKSFDNRLGLTTILTKWTVARCQY